MMGADFLLGAKLGGFFHGTLSRRDESQPRVQGMKIITDLVA